jgi:hypothetical protein
LGHPQRAPCTVVPLEPPAAKRVWRKGGENENIFKSWPGYASLRPALSGTPTEGSQYRRARRQRVFRMARLIAAVALGTVTILLARSAYRVYRQVPDEFEPVPLLPAPSPEAADA